MTTAGDIIYSSDGSGTPARLAMGSALQVLRVNAGGTALEYAAAAGGDAGELDIMRNNIALLAMRQLIDNGGSLYAMQDQFVDTFQDQAGVDLAASINASYNSVLDRYAPLGNAPNIVLISDTTDGSTTFVDETGSNATVVVNGSTYHSTALGATGDPFGGPSSSVRFDGSGDSIEFSGGSIAIGTSPFYVAAWVMIDNTSGNKCIASSYLDSGDGWRLLVVGAQLQVAVDATTPVSGGTLSANTWHHVALSRNGSNLMQLYLDGTRVSSATVPADLSSAVGIFEVGGTNGTGNNSMLGYIDSVAMEIGTAGLYDGASCPVPTADPSALSSALDLTLVSVSQTAEAVPTTARAVLKLNDTGTPLNLNTDVFVDFSRDGGTTWTTATLRDQGTYSTNIQILDTAATNISAQPSGTSMRIRVRTVNNIPLYVEDWAMQWA
jgi:hypothetical protein